MPSYDAFKVLNGGNLSSGTERGDATKLLSSAIKPSMANSKNDIDNTFTSKKKNLSNQDIFETLVTSNYNRAINKKDLASVFFEHESCPLFFIYKKAKIGYGI